jgi:hypothetical protein
MPILQIEHAVRDFDVWKQAFDRDPVGRAQGGVLSYRILRGADEPNFVVIDLEFGTLDEAEAFRGRLEQLWGRVTEELGLERRRARILETAETSSGS